MEKRARVFGNAVPLIVSLTAVAGGVGAQGPEASTRLVNVNGHPTRVVEVGVRDRRAGEPVLLVLAGSVSSIETWGGWLADLSELAPVVTYDRPGIGRSEYDGSDASPARAVRHAHDVLDALSVPPPYVLVGHSWGGTLALFYAGTYPSEVVGVVYLDPFDPREPPPADALPPSIMRLPLGERTEVEAIAAFQNTPIEDRAIPADLDVPTAVLLSTLPPSFEAAPPRWTRDYWESWMAQKIARYTELVRGRRQGTLTLATDAGHNVHLDAPELATALVDRVLAATRSP